MLIYDFWDEISCLEEFSSASNLSIYCCLEVRSMEVEDYEDFKAFNSFSRFLFISVKLCT